MAWGGLDAYLALMDRLTEASRDSLASERIQQRAQEQQRNLTEARRRQQGWSITDLDGRRWLELTQLAGFQQLCYGELELQEACSWGPIPWPAGWDAGAPAAGACGPPPVEDAGGEFDLPLIEVGTLRTV